MVNVNIKFGIYVFSLNGVTLEYTSHDNPNPKVGRVRGLFLSYTLSI